MTTTPKRHSPQQIVEGIFGVVLAAQQVAENIVDSTDPDERNLKIMALQSGIGSAGLQVVDLSPNITPNEEQQPVRLGSRTQRTREQVIAAREQAAIQQNFSKPARTALFFRITRSNPVK
ncbi:hypothetical protein H7Y63_00605 [Polaromonas sp.]|nr:hypothetical protein [Candidatus Saccharibacteria bacterium]